MNDFFPRFFLLNEKNLSTRVRVWKDNEITLSELTPGFSGDKLRFNETLLQSFIFFVGKVAMLQRLLDEFQKNTFDYKYFVLLIDIRSPQSTNYT